MGALRARVLVEAAPVDGLGAEVEAALDLDPVDIEAIARLDVGALLAFEIGVLDGVDLVRAGGQIPGGFAGGIEPGLADVPLQLHASYSREEILAALGWTNGGRTPSTMREGVAWCPDISADAFLITLKKTETEYSPTTMYRDFALSSELFHWESQSTTSSTSATGQRYIHHRDRGTHVLLFVREQKEGLLGASPYVFLGPAEYVTHEGDRPMAVTWKLKRPMPTEVYLASRAAVA